MKIRSFGDPLWDVSRVTAPWGDRPSIYRHVLSHLSSDGSGLGEGGERLPDEEIVRGESGIGWVAGGLDGAFGHHGGGEPTQTAHSILRALKSLIEKATDERAAQLYSLLKEHAALDYVDQLLEAIVADKKIAFDRLHAVARWLATEAPDREPVKTAIAILGVLQGGEDRDLLLTLGRHEEFTLYTAVALQNTEGTAAPLLWELGKEVTGWGRIQIIERLAGTEDERIKAWLLREGYRNDIMNEYTALVCAETGDLLEALRTEEPDDRLLKGAGAILVALIQGRGGPVEGIEAYPEGAEAAELYLRHLSTRVLDLEDFVAVTVIERFLREEEDEGNDIPLGWQQRRANLLEQTGAIRSRPGWEEKVREKLKSDDRLEFGIATEAAVALGLDIWEVYFERLERGEDQWYFAMQTDDPERINRVVQLAEERLPLAEIATGAADELGLGPEYQAHSALDFVLQDLRRFPGKGWKLIRTGLLSPVTRNRNMALRALAAWERETWSNEAELLLRRALEVEPNTETRDSMRKVLRGEALEF